MVLADRLTLFLLHIDRYLAYEKDHEVELCHQLCLQLFDFLCQFIKASLKIMQNI